MTHDELAQRRLSNQQLVHSNFASAQEVVAWMGAMQAQDYEMAKWGIGIRIPGLTAQAVEASLDKGEIIRTHVLRPTWHIVAAQDLRWMLALSAPQQRKLVYNMARKFDLDSLMLNRCNEILEKSLSGNNCLTRREIVAELKKQGIDTNDLRANLLIINAELEGIICSGPRREKQLTYALVEERVPPTPLVSREEALAALANRYFTSHGPATEYDFSWWSGLTLTDARKGLEMVKSSLTSVQVDEHIYFFRPSTFSFQQNEHEVKTHHLPAFDEFLVSYKDRTASLDRRAIKEVITSNGIFRPVIVVKGKVVGTWKRITKSNRIYLEYQGFSTEKMLNKERLSGAVERFSHFSGMELIIQDMGMSVLQ